MKSKTFFALIRVQLYQMFTSMMTSRRRTSKANLVALSSILLPIAFCLYVTGVYTFTMVHNLTEPYRYLILIMGAVLATAIVFFLTFYHASAYLFQFKDYDLLMSLPIPDSAVLTSKLLAFYLYNYFFTFFLMVAPVIGYVYMSPAISPFFFVAALLGSLVLPILPLMFSAVVAFLITFLASRFKYRNRMMTVISFLFLICIMFASMQINSIIMMFSGTLDGIMPALQTWYPPVYYYVSAMHDLAGSSLLIGLGIGIVVAVIFVFVFAKAFKVLNSLIRMSPSSKRIRYNEGKVVANGVMKALVKKEVSRYLNSHSYILNTLTGPVVAIVGTVYMLFTSPAQLEIAMEIPGFADNMVLVLIAMMAFLSVVSCTTASSISLEGKYVWLLKSLPLKHRDIFIAKIILNLLVLIPILSLMAIILAIRFEFALLDVILLLLFIWTTAIYVSLSGLVVNLHFPKMDWISEVSVVKQSMSVIVCLALGMILFGAMVYGYIKLGMQFPKEAGLGVCLGILIAICAGLWMYLRTKGTQLFDAL